MYPQERELVVRLKDRPFVLLSVNTDPERETLRKAIRDGEITWRCWWDGLRRPDQFAVEHPLLPGRIRDRRQRVNRQIGTRGKDLDQTVDRPVEEAMPKGGE